MMCTFVFTMELYAGFHKMAKVFVIGMGIVGSTLCTWNSSMFLYLRIGFGKRLPLLLYKDAYLGTCFASNIILQLTQFPRKFDVTKSRLLFRCFYFWICLQELISLWMANGHQKYPDLRAGRGKSQVPLQCEQTRQKLFNGLINSSTPLV